ncbi:MAG: lytic murein transglycosylase, partial [Pseudoalteromonas sp.]
MELIVTKLAFKKLAILLCSACISTSALANTKAQFNEYVNNLKLEAKQKGYDEKLINDAFQKVEFKEKVISADKSQPEVKETLETYLPKRVPQWKVDRARKLYKENQQLLDQVAKEFGVQARFIVALWGLESNFGKIQGGHNVIESVVTLAFDGRRETMYKKQLWAALDILKEGHITLDKFKGSWAGAMGQTQFMPTSFN